MIEIRLAKTGFRYNENGDPTHQVALFSIRQDSGNWYAYAAGDIPLAVADVQAHLDSRATELHARAAAQGEVVEGQRLIELTDVSGDNALTLKEQVLAQRSAISARQTAAQEDAVEAAGLPNGLAKTLIQRMLNRELAWCEYQLAESQREERLLRAVQHVVEML